MGLVQQVKAFSTAKPCRWFSVGHPPTNTCPVHHWSLPVCLCFEIKVSLCSTVNNKIKVPPGAEELVGRAVEHLFEKEDGEKNEWRGMVLSRAPIMTHWYYITYEKDPVLYMYQLWDDYKDGDLRVLPESGTEVRACVWSICCACMFTFKRFKSVQE